MQPRASKASLAVADLGASTSCRGPGARAGGDEPRWLPRPDLRWLLRLMYPPDRVTQLLTNNPLPLTRRRARLLWALVRSSVFDERLRFLKMFTPRRPNGVAIEITNACNLRCRMCNWTEMSRPLQRMDLAVYRRIVDRCAEAGVVNVGSTPTAKRCCIPIFPR